MRSATKETPRILVIDDEESLCQLIEYALRKTHQVTIATQAAQGLELLLGNEKFDVVFCDLMMPGLSGMDLYSEVRRQRPELEPSIIFMSGGAFTPEAEGFVENLPEGRMLEKPFALKEIRRIVESRRNP